MSKSDDLTMSLVDDNGREAIYPTNEILPHISEARTPMKNQNSRKP